MKGISRCFYKKRAVLVEGGGVGGWVRLVAPNAIHVQVEGYKFYLSR